MLEKRLLSLREAAEYLHLSCSQLYQNRNKIGLPFIKIGNAIRFDLQDLNAFIESRKCNRTDPNHES